MFGGPETISARWSLLEALKTRDRVVKEEKEKEIIEIVENLGERNDRAAGALGLMAGAAQQRFEPGGRENVPHLYKYFRTCLKEGVPLETIREVIRIIRS